MSSVLKRMRAVMTVGVLLASASATAFADDRSVEAIVKDLDAAQAPALDRTKIKDKDYVQEYMAKRQEAAAKRGKLTQELLKVAPDHEKLVELLPEYWMSTDPRPDKGEKLFKEINETLARTKNPKLVIEGTFLKAQLKLFLSGGDKPDTSALDEFIKLAPKDPRAGQLLFMAAQQTEDQAAKSALEDRVVKEFPDSQFVDMIKGARHRRESIGKPFELEFTDAIKGTALSMNDLKGKVVVIDFWATWCGPCIAEMPEMKKIYAEYHDKGVEFIGVSLDQPKEAGGLDALKKYVAENEVPWPQYYQGNGWNSEFSKKWGINSIPSMFVVAADGNLYSVEARGKLETMLPELLKQKGDAPGDG